MIKKINFTFKNENFKTLFEMTKDGNFKKPSKTIKEALEIFRSLQNFAKEGFCEVIIRNPFSGEEILTRNKHLVKLSKKYIENLNKETIQNEQSN